MYAKSLTREQLKAIKIGDVVTRNMCGIRMDLKVTDVDDTLIHCSGWTFSRDTGAEYDELIQLPPPYVISMLEEVKETDENVPDDSGSV